MRAMVLIAPNHPLELQEVARPEPAPGQILVQVEACGVCRTDLHLCDGELQTRYPIIPGHQIVGRVVAVGDEKEGPWIGKRVGVAWLWRCCGKCSYCLEGRENLCDAIQFTGCHVNGGFAQYCIACSDFVYPLPEEGLAANLAPLLCAGMIGYRSLKMIQEAQRIGFYGFGAAAHLLLQLARSLGKEVYAFVKEGDDASAQFARDLGATWAGSSKDTPPQPLDGAILFAPVGALLPQALRAIRKGGSVVCAGIHMSDIPSFPYSLLWGEKTVRSVANLTRADGREFLPLALKIPIKSTIKTYPLDEANRALSDLKNGRIDGSAVLVI
jgi:propanol-preferring alcohol dehydrogenase